MVELVGGGNDRKKVGNHCAITMNRELHNREQGHKDNTITTMGCICQSYNPEGVLKTVKPSVQVRKVLTYFRSRDK